MHGGPAPIPRADQHPSVSVAMLSKAMGLKVRPARLDFVRTSNRPLGFGRILELIPAAVESGGHLSSLARAISGLPEARGKRRTDRDGLFGG